jgi:hypothetical protein
MLVAAWYILRKKRWLILRMGADDGESRWYVGKREKSTDEVPTAVWEARVRSISSEPNRHRSSRLGSSGGRSDGMASLSPRGSSPVSEERNLPLLEYLGDLGGPTPRSQPMSDPGVVPPPPSVRYVHQSFGTGEVDDVPVPPLSWSDPGHSNFRSSQVPLPLSGPPSSNGHSSSTHQDVDANAHLPYYFTQPDEAQRLGVHRNPSWHATPQTTRHSRHARSHSHSEGRWWNNGLSPSSSVYRQNTWHPVPDYKKPRSEPTSPRVVPVSDWTPYHSLPPSIHLSSSPPSLTDRLSEERESSSDEYGGSGRSTMTEVTTPNSSVPSTTPPIDESLQRERSRMKLLEPIRERVDSSLAGGSLKSKDSVNALPKLQLFVSLFRLLSSRFVSAGD